MVFPKEKNGKKILDSLSWEEFFKETKKLKTFPLISPIKNQYLTSIYGLKKINLLSYIDSNYQKITKLIQGKTVFVIGSGPSLSFAIPKLKKFKKSIKIAADSSLKPLLENGIVPDIIVTDLDGDEDAIKKLSKKKSIFVIHAHGDNIKKLQMVKE